MIQCCVVFPNPLFHIIKLPPRYTQQKIKLLLIQSVKSFTTFLQKLKINFIALYYFVFCKQRFQRQIKQKKNEKEKGKGNEKGGRKKSEN